jgi:cytochrome P450
LGDEELVARVAKAGMSLAAYFTDLIERRRGNPGDDLLSVLISAEEEGERLSHLELISQSIGLLIAGFETTIGLIGNGLTTLIRNPEEIEKLRAQPDLVVSAVEECLRYSGPILATVRVLHEDSQFGDYVIPIDTEVVALLAAGNRDPDHFEDPERFNVARYMEGSKAAPHLSFGGGAHHCLGAHLARLETQVAIGTLVRRFEELTLLNESTEWGRSLFRVPRRIPVRFREASP